MVSLLSSKSHSISTQTAARRNRLRRALLEMLEQRALMAVDLGLDVSVGSYTYAGLRSNMDQAIEYLHTNQATATGDPATTLSRTLGSAPGGLTSQPWFPLISEAYDRWSQQNDLAFTVSTSDPAVAGAMSLQAEGEGLVAEGEAGGPRFLSVSPNSGEIFSFNYVNTLTEAPTELVFRFDGANGISPSTIQNGIRVTRAGNDGTFGNSNDQVLVGQSLFGDNNRVVIVRFASALPDDLYRIEVFGTDGAGTTAIRSTSNLTLQTRVAGTTKDTVDFKLELGAQVVAVVPQPTRVLSRTVVADFANTQFLSGAHRFVNDTAVTLSSTGTLPAGLSGTATYYVINSQTNSLQLASSVGGTAVPFTSNGTGALTLTRKSASAITPQLDQIEVYFNNDDLYSVPTWTGAVTPNPTVVDPNFYQLVFTNDSVQPTDDVRFVPTAVSYDPVKDMAILTFANAIDKLAGAGTYRLRVGNNEVVASATNPPVITSLTPSEPGGNKTSANTALGTVSGSTATSFSIKEEIRVASASGQLNLDYPGNSLEPGHRDIPNNEETHLAASSDANLEITTAFYNFAENSQGVRRPYGTNALGQPVYTSITPEQKQRVREIFEFYSTYLGIDFVETEASGMTVVVGDLFPNGGVSGGGTLGIANTNNIASGLAIMDGNQLWNNALGQSPSPSSNPSFFEYALHEIGHMIGYGHDSELPLGTVMRGTGPGQAADPVYPGDQDIVHGQNIYRPDNRDIDMYRFDVPANVTGRVNLEIVAERDSDSSNLDSHLTLFKENAAGNLEIVSLNDDYFSSDSFISTKLTAGRYYVGVAASGNQDFNPLTSDTGAGGVSQGKYQLKFDFLPDAQSSIVDLSSTRFDGDGDGQPGGAFNFWFRALPPIDQAPAGTPKTIYVDKGYLGTQTGSASQPFNNLQTAANAVGPGDVIRVVASAGADGKISTSSDNPAYEIGRGGVGNAALSDGVTFEVPNGVTMMIDAGSIFKMGGSRIVAGSRDAGIDNRYSSIQLLGTPYQSVNFTSYNDQNQGTDTNPLVTTPQPGDWGGVEIHNDVDRSEGRGDYERQGIFLNYLAFSDMRYGGGRITVATPSPTINPIHLSEARPTLLYNRITLSADSAISADPNSFEETRFTEPRYQLAAQFTPDYDRVGPVIRGNTLTSNPINGLFVRIPTLAGNKLQTLDLQARLDDRDIVYVLGENLIINGTPGGSFQETLAPDVSLVQTIVSPTGLTGNSVQYKVTAIDRFGSEGIPSAATPAITVGRLSATVDNTTDIFTATGHGLVDGAMVNLLTTGVLPVGTVAGTVYYVVNATANTFQIARTSGGSPVNLSTDGTGTLTVQQAVQLTNLPQAFGDFVGRRLWRSDNAGAYRLVAELDGDTPVFVDAGQDLKTTLANPNATSLQRARPDARLAIDPGIIIKSLNSRIEVGVGAQLIAEGTAANKIIFTSRSDDRFGAAGSFDTNNDGNTNPSAGAWGGIIARQLSSLSIDSALITYAGGITSVPGGFAGFNPIEVHQATARIANSKLENNASGLGGNLDSTRDGRGTHEAASIFVRGAQPTIIGNIIQKNSITGTAAISIDANSMKAVSLQDPGRQTGLADKLPGALGNAGPLVKDNLLAENGLNAMRIRGATLTTESVWDDVDIVHVLQGEVIVPDFHTYGGLRLQSKVDGSLVVKMGAGANVGLTATGTPLDIVDRVGGSIQVLGTPGFPVVITSIKDDTVGAGFDPTGKPLLDTGNDGATAITAADAWRSIKFDQNSNDRNLDTVLELEPDQIQDAGLNDDTLKAQSLGGLADNLLAGDENLRLGYTIHGSIASPSDLDIYSFAATAGTLVYLDLDRTDAALDTVVELIDISGRIIALSDNSLAESVAGSPTYINTSLIASDKVQTLDTSAFAQKNSWNGTASDFQSVNPNDAGFRVVLPGAIGSTNTYYLRVRSSNVGPGQSASRLQDTALLRSGLSEGAYRLQLRLQQKDEIAGSTFRYADLRYPTNGIEAIGLPGHSPLLGRTSSPVGGNNYGPLDTPSVGNISASDRASISLAGSISPSNDVDYYQFTIGRQLTQGSSGTHVAASFDIDYASGYGGPNTSLWLYRVVGSGLQLIMAGTDSNITDDRTNPTKGSNLEDQSRGSLGALDAYIGTQELPAGNYVIAVSNNSLLATQLRQFQEPNPANPLVRLEPLDSIQRIAVDRFEAANQRETTLGPKQVAFSGNANAVPWTLGDVTAYAVSSNASNSRVSLADGFTGALEGYISSASFTQPRVQDAAMSPDGRLVGMQIPTGTQTDSNSGSLIQLDSTGVTGTSTLGNSGIQTFTTEQVSGNWTVQQRTIAGATQGDGIQFNAITFYDSSGTLQMYGIGSRGNGITSYVENDNGTTLGRSFDNYNTTNILYRLDPSTGAAINPTGVVDRTGNGRTNGNHAGTQKVEFGRFLSGTLANNYTDGTVTGMTYVGNTLYAVSDKGELFSAAIGTGNNSIGGQIPFTDNTSVPPKRYTGKVASAIINDPTTGLPVAFTALTTGPRNVNGGAYASLLFGTTSDGTIYAFNTAGVLQPVFPGGNVSVKSNSATLSNVVGFAFSPLDVNLWHLTDTQGAVAGHGRPATPDDSRTASQNGTNSMYFGFENPANTFKQTGTWSGIYDVAAYRNTYNLPGGAHGAMESASIDLRGYSSTDLPMLYFTYYLSTQNSNSPNNDGDTQMQDAFRVYAAGDNGQWVLLTTNNSAKSGNFGDGNDEYDQGITGYVDENGRPIQPQEAYDVGDGGAPDNWRQARASLAPFAGQKDVKIRFEFSTAGSFATNDPRRGGFEITAIEGSRLSDGDAFSVAEVDIAAPRTFRFEFDLGLVLDLPGGASIRNGDVLTVNGTPYTFSTSINTGNNIQYNLSDSPAQIATKVRTKLTGAGFTVVTNPIRTNVLNVTSAPSGGSYSVSGLPASTIVSLPGVSGTNVRIPVDQSMSAQQVRDAIRTALAATFNAVGQTANTGVWPVYNNTIRMFKYQVPTGLNGPLQVSARVGDSFGNDIANGGTSLTSMARQAQNNAQVGVFIDDIVIALAERGEMVLNAPTTNVGSGSNQNAALFSSNLQYQQSGFTVGTPPQALTEIEQGRYQLEIRTSAEYGNDGGTSGRLNLTPNPVNPNLPRTFDSNDRLAKSVGLRVAAGGAAVIPDGATFTLSDGVSLVTFEFDVTQAATDRATGISPGNVRIALNTSDTAQQVATKIRNSINSTTVQALLKVSASIQGEMLAAPSTDIAPSGSTVVMLNGSAALTRTGGITIPANTGLTVLTWGVDTTSGEDGGDTNRLRDQGMILIMGTSVTNSTQYGISIDAAARANSGPTFPGAPVNYPTVNTAGLAPGVVVMNNVLANNTLGGLLISGDQLLNSSITNLDVARPSTIARVINNTIYGRNSGDTAIRANDGAAPTILNNIIANSATGIDVTGASSSLVIGANLYFNIATANQLVPSTTPQSFAVQATASPFVNAASGFFYPAVGSPAIDSSLEALAEIAALTQVKSTLGLPPSPALAPDRDTFGQRRVDDTTVNDSSGVGSNVFKDRGAVERADTTNLQVIILQPQDNDSANVDKDRNDSYIRLNTGSLTFFSLLLVDGEGTGPNSATVTQDAIILTENGRLLTPGVDYVFGYNANSRTVQLTPIAGMWRNDSVYEITLINKAGHRITLDETKTYGDGNTYTFVAGTTTLVFELDTNSSTVSGRIPVPISSGASAYEIVTKLSYAINNTAAAQTAGLRSRIEERGSLFVEGATSVSSSNANALVKAVGAIQDRAGNPLYANRATSLTQFTILMPEVGLDFGDASGISIPTVEAAVAYGNGARHALLPIDEKQMLLGTLVDSEPDGLRSPGADGDDMDSLVDLQTLGTSGGVIFNPIGPTLLTMADANTLLTQKITITDVPAKPLYPVEFKFADIVTAGDSADTVATKFAAAVNAAVLAGKLTNMIATANGPQVSLGLWPQYAVDLSAAPAVIRQAVGNMTLAIPSAHTVQDGQTFSIRDGAGKVLVFELNDPNSPTSPFTTTGNVAINIPNLNATPSTVTAATIASAIQTAINGRVTAGDLKLAASTIGSLSLGTPPVTYSTVSVTPDDEDGVRFGKTDSYGVVRNIFNANSTANTLTVTASAVGVLDVWFDWNADGDFSDGGEQYLTSKPVNAGDNVFAVTTPATATIGTTNARFRLSVTGGLLPNGIAIGGETEDYLIEIVAGSPPVVVTDTYNVDEDTVLTVPLVNSILKNDTDADGTVVPGTNLFVYDQDPTTAAINPLVNVTRGTLVLSADGSYTYTPNQDFNGTDTFVYLATDGRLVSEQSHTVTINVNAINDPVNLVDDLITTKEDKVVPLVSASLTSNDKPYPTSYNLNDFAAKSDKTQTLSLVDTKIIGNAASDFGFGLGNLKVGFSALFGLVSGVMETALTINYAVQDIPAGAPVSVTVAGRVLNVVLNSNASAQATVNDLIAAINASSANTSFGLTASLATGLGTTVLGVTGATYTAVSVAPVGSLSFTSGQWSYTPPAHINQDIVGNVVLRVKIQDDTTAGPLTTGGGPTATGAASFGFSNVTLQITPVNDAPEYTLGTIPTASLKEDIGAVTVTGFVTGVRVGPVEATDEAATQTFTAPNGSVVITAVTPSLFKTQPTLTKNGSGDYDLSYELAANVNKDAPFAAIAVVVTFTDSGPNVTANGDVNSTTKTFTILPKAVNDAPEFTLGATPTELEDKDVTLTNFITAVRTGPTTALDEIANQVISSVVITALDPTQFATLPTLTKNGSNNYDLKYKTAANYNKETPFTPILVTVAMTDNGPNDATNGDVNSTTKTLTIQPTAVNDEPEFTLGVNPTPAEDAATTITDFVTGVRVGPTTALDELATQSIAGVVITAVTPSQFAVQPTLTKNGSGNYDLAFTTAANINTAAQFAPILVTVTFTDSGINGGANLDDNTATKTFTVLPKPVNDAPEFTLGANPTELEDKDVTLTNFITAVRTGPTTALDEIATQVISSVVITAVDPSQFATLPTLTKNGSNNYDLKYKTAANYNKEAPFTPILVTVAMTDNGPNDATNADVNSTTKTFTILPTAVNDEPEFTLGANPTPAEDAATTITDFVTGVRVGPTTALDELATQTIASVVITAVTPSQFATQPTLTLNGSGNYDLAFTTAANINTAAQFQPILVTVTFTDSGINGGANLDDNTATKTFTVLPKPVNDAPEFTLGANPTELEDKDVTLTNFITAVRTGPTTALDEIATQVISSVVITAVDPNQFATLPTLTKNGSNNYDLKYKTAANYNKEAPFTPIVVTVTMTDNGPNVGSNADVNSTTKTFTILPTAVNDEPEFTLGANPTPAEDAATTITDFVTGVRVGPTTALDELATQSIAGVVITAVTPSQFATQPTLTLNGSGNYDLAFTTAANVNTAAQFQPILVTVTFTDSGINGGANLDDNTATKTFTILPKPVNDAPEFTLGANPTELEDKDVTLTNFITAVRTGPTTALDEIASQVISSVVITAVDPTQFATLPTLTKNGSNNYDLKYKTAANYNKEAPFTPIVVTVTMTDNGPNVANNADVNSTTKTFTILPTAVNDEPEFTLGANPTPAEDAATTITDFVTGVRVGPTTALDELATQTIASVVITAVTPGQFAVQPTLTKNGSGNYDLAFTTAANINTASPFAPILVTVTFTDSGINGGANLDDNTATKTFTILPKPVNDAPEFTLGANPTNPEDSDVTIANFVTNVRTGPVTALDELASQTISTVVITAVTPSQFATLPTLTKNGSNYDLKYKTAINYNKEAPFAPILVTVTFTDSGPNVTANGDVNSGSKTFTILPSAVNDAPSFTLPSTLVTVYEDNEAVIGAAQSSFPNFATNIAVAPSTALDEIAAQSRTFEVVRVVNSNLFKPGAGQPAIDSTGKLTFQTNTDQNGQAEVVVRLRDSGGSPGVDVSGEQSFTITILPVNDAPQFNVPASLTVEEDAGVVRQAGFASSIRRGPVTAPDEDSQTIQFHVAAQDPTLFEIQPTIEVDGTLTFKTAANVNSANSVFVITAYLTDNGSNTSPNVNISSTKSFSLSVTPVNDDPIADIYAINGIEDQSLTILASDILKGDVGGPTPDELGQTLIITQVELVTALGGTVTPFYTGSAITSLVYQPAPNTAGTDSFKYVITDNGTPPRSGTGLITIRMSGFNDPPQFSKGPDQTVLEDAGTQSVANWATGILPGPPAAFDELASQTVSFEVIVDKPQLFATLPFVASDGTLTYKTAPDAVGSAVVTVVAVDSGPSTPPDNNRSPAQQFFINITPANDQPVFTPGLPISVVEDSGPYSAFWASGIAPAAGLLTTPPTATDEASQKVTFYLSADRPDLFAVPPAMDPSGRLTFTPSLNKFGTAIVSVIATDDGPVGPNDRNTSAPQYLVITIAPANDAPVAVADLFLGDENNVLVIPAPGVLANDTDLDFPADKLEAVPATVVTSLGATAIINPDGSISYDPRSVEVIQKLTTGQSIADQFQYQVKDAAGAVSSPATVTVVIAGIDDAPIAVPDRFTVPVGQTGLLDVVKNDVDIDSPIDRRSIVITSFPAFGTVAVTADGLVQYIPGVGFRGLDSFGYKVRDVGGNLSNEAMVSVIVNNAPRAGNDSAYTIKNQSVTIDVLANDIDLDGSIDRNSIEIVSQPFPSGTVTKTSNGMLTYTPDADFYGKVKFSYLVYDNVGSPSNVAEVLVTVLQSAWQNPSNNYDVNSDGSISPIDALFIINYLNDPNNPAYLPGSGIVAPPYYDVNGDEYVTSVDVLLLINYLNTTPSIGGEGEGPLALGAPLIVTAVTPEQMVATVGSQVVQEVEAELAEALAACSPWSSDGEGDSKASNGIWNSDVDDDSVAGALAEAQQLRRRRSGSSQVDSFFDLF